jgi:dinuclear metal center YbgI/SA1388 family protein
MMTIGDVIEWLEGIAPRWMADEGDPGGLQVGDPSADVESVCAAVDASAPVVDQAIEQGAGLLIVHHPVIYNPIKSLAAGDVLADKLTKLIRGRVAVYVMHTNLDTAPGGLSDVLAEVLGVQDTIPLTNRRQDSIHKIVVFVPEEALGAVRDAMAEAGAGGIGKYSHCSFRSAGVGTFVPLEGAQPYIGGVGKLEEVGEYRLEMICPASSLEVVVDAMRGAHPYEEVAYDVYELANEPRKVGFGRVGTLEQPISLADFAERVRAALNLDCMRVAGDRARLVRTVAVCPGSGSRFAADAIRCGADVYIAGELRHFDILDANAQGMAMIDAGHFETERPGMVALVDRQQRELNGRGLRVGYIE